MVCKNCGKEFEGSFCPDCGAVVEEIQDTQQMTSCPNCGAERVGEGKFCVACGYNYEEPTQSAQPTQESGTKNAQSSGKALKVLSKLYRWLLAGGMILVGIISLLCLTAPVITENFLGESEALCTGFEAISGKDSSIPTAIAGASKILLVLSILALVYGVVQLILAIKKPYVNTLGKKKFVFWGIDGVISILLIVSGGIMSSQAKSESFMEGKLGSGFAFAIVMGVFALLFLAARIFYELKLFKIEDTGLSEEQVANLTEKKKRKKLTKKQIMAIIIPVVTVVVLVAVIVPSVIWANNIFRVGKVDKINIGDSQEQVIKILGEPYEKSNYRYEYYSDNYLKVLQQLDKIYGNERGLVALASNDDDIDLDDWGDDFGEDNEEKLREQLRTMTYQYICVEFDNDKKVSSVFFDKAKCDSKEDDKKTVKSYDVQGGTSIQQYDTLNLTYNVKYTDGSFYKTTAYNQIIFDLDTNIVDWVDGYGNKYSVNISVAPITTLTSDIVTMIAGGDKSTLTEFEIASDITAIGASAFRGCSNLMAIVIPSKVTSIGASAFSDCNNLTIYCNALSKPSDWSNNWNAGDRPVYWGSIGSYVDDNGLFYLISVDNTVSVKASSGISGDIEILSKINFKGSQYAVTNIGDEAFYTCRSLTSVTIPSSVTSIGSKAFYGCSRLTSITISSSVTNIGDDAFYNCSDLTRVYITDIASWCAIELSNIFANPLFYAEKLYLNNELVTELVIPNSVTSIGTYAFCGCSSLTNITFGDNSQLISIGYGAFYGCSSLTSVTIPSSVTSIGNGAFYECSSLTSVTFENTSGWCVTDSDATSSTSVDVTNASTNATYFKSTTYVWKRDA